MVPNFSLYFFRSKAYSLYFFQKIIYIDNQKLLIIKSKYSRKYSFSLCHNSLVQGEP